VYLHLFDRMAEVVLMANIETENQAIISNYSLLKDLGLIDLIDRLNLRINDLEELLVEASELFSKDSIETIIEATTKFLVDKFVPSNLVFIIRESDIDNNLQIVSFKNMKRVESTIDFESIQPYEAFFREYPSSISYELFEFQFKNTAEIKKISPAEPEIVVPIIGISGLYGIILFGKKILESDYSSEEITYVDKLMKFAAIAIQNNIHYTKSVTDVKTGLYNHSFFIERLEEELARAKRYESSIAVLVLDLDHFKLLNDKHGHLAGDKVLIEVSDILRNSCRRGDIVSRFGGEEFTVLLIENNKYGTYQTAERLRKKIEESEINYFNSTLTVTVSIGCSFYSKYNPVENVNDFIKQADTALYESKANGRNQSTVYKAGLFLNALKSVEEK
jgi:diguanylate cyclase (GGDEF)-like protein